MTALEIIRLVGGEFKDMDDETISKWIEVVRPMVSKKQFGKLYEQAIALLVCHKLKLQGEGTSPLGNINPLSAGFGLSSYSAGSLSMSFGASQSSNIGMDAEYGLTIYGMQYLQLRRMVIIPIHCSGESSTT